MAVSGSCARRGLRRGRHERSSNSPPLRRDDVGPPFLTQRHRLQDIKCSQCSELDLLQMVYGLRMRWRVEVADGRPYSASAAILQTRSSTLTC
jgi:hypothetical protein